MTEDAPCSEVFVFKFLKRYDLDDRGLMSLLNNVKLVFVGKAEHNEVSFTEGSYHNISSLTCYSHCIERLMCLDCVITTLKGFIPYLQCMIAATSQEFSPLI